MTRTYYCVECGLRFSEPDDGRVMLHEDRELGTLCVDCEVRQATEQPGSHCGPGCGWCGRCS